VEQSIEPQVFDVLVYLVAANGRVVTKEELLDEVWGDRFVSESALTTRIKSVRKAVGDSGTTQSVIRTVHGKGYSFCAELHDSPAAGADPVTDGAASSTSGRHKLPGAVHRLIGRDTALHELETELDRGRLITLVGPAGVGKTALAYEVARAREHHYADGVVAVELVTVDADAALNAVATALEVHPRQGQQLEDAVLDWLSPRQTLVLLDNCEHVVEPLSTMVGQILRSAPQVTILATSREPLALAGEQLWPVDPLEVSTSDAGIDGERASDAGPAVMLFVERATAADPRFAINETNADAVAEICRRLDGVPLAIELAAARVGALDINEIASRLDERFRLLKGVRRGADPRHRVLEDAVRWSYDLLEPRDQQLFAELSIFAGKFDLADAEHVCSDDGALDVLDGLASLADRSMLATRRPDVGAMRYEMLETMRDYGRSRLDDDDSVSLHQRHAVHYATFAAEVSRVQGTTGEGAIARRADAAFPSLRAAFGYAVQVQDVDTAFTLCTEIREYAMRSMRYEALRWADTALELDGSDHALHATVRGVSAYGAWVRGEFDTALSLAEQTRADEQAKDLTPSGLAERVIGNVLYAQGDDEGGRATTQRLVEIAEASGDASRMAHAYYMHSVAHSSVSRFDASALLARQAQQCATESGSPTDMACALAAVGFATHGDPGAALEAFREADRLALSVGNRWLSAFARTEACVLQFGAGEVAEACAGLADVIDTWFRFGEWAQQWLTMSRGVVALAGIDRTELACQVVGAIEQHATVAPTPVMASLRDQMMQTTESLRQTVGVDRYDDLRAAGATRPVVDVVHETSATLSGRH
jgi:predicted ATPase/DNA-binding winged helix-turn-helix (wHTH) protein